MHSTGNIPPKFRDRTLEGYVASTTTTAKALAAAKRFGEGEILHLVLSGSVGAGKTHLAAGAAKARAAREDTNSSLKPWERDPEWQNVAALVVGLRDDMHKRKDRKWSYRVEELREDRGVLVLDDLGQEKMSDWTAETLYDLINHRYEHNCPTIITTNLAGVAMAASPYWPVISRLAEDGELVRIEAPDYRLTRASPT